MLFATKANTWRPVSPAVPSRSLKDTANMMDLVVRISLTVGPPGRYLILVVVAAVDLTLLTLARVQAAPEDGNGRGVALGSDGVVLHVLEPKFNS